MVVLNHAYCALCITHYVLTAWLEYGAMCMEIKRIGKRKRVGLGSETYQYDFPRSVCGTSQRSDQCRSTGSAELHPYRVPVWYTLTTIVSQPLVSPYIHPPRRSSPYTVKVHVRRCRIACFHPPLYHTLLVNDDAFPLHPGYVVAEFTEGEVDGGSCSYESLCRIV